MRPQLNRSKEGALLAERWRKRRPDPVESIQNGFWSCSERHGIEARGAAGLVEVEG